MRRWKHFNGGQGIFGLGEDPILNMLLAVFTFAVVIIMLVRSGGSLPLRLHTTQLPDASAWNRYEAGLRISGGTGPYRFILENTDLPPGLALTDNQVGVISGVPRSESLSSGRKARTWSIKVRIQDQSSQQVEGTVALKVCPAAVAFDPDEHPLKAQHETERLPPAFVGSPYECVIGAIGGIEPYQATMEGLPRGLKCNQEGRVVGKPGEAGLFSVVLTLRDAQDPNNQLKPCVRQYQLSVFSVARLEAKSILPDARLEQNYEGAVAAVGGRGPYQFKVNEGRLPAGLELDAGSGLVTGRPSEPGETSFVVLVRDSCDPVQSREILSKIRVWPALPPFKLAMPGNWTDADQGGSYGFSLSCTGGIQPITWHCEGLPEGLSLRGTEITGEVTAPVGPHSIKVTATDASGDVQQGEYVVRVRPPRIPLKVEYPPARGE